MNPEMLHEALNDLDDELIEEVELLREKGVKPSRRARYAVAIAACFCVLAVGLLAVRFGQLWQPLNTKVDGESEKATDIGTTITEIMPEDNIVTEPFLDGQSTTAAMPGAHTTPTVGNTQAVERPSAQVKIVRWEENGFLAEVTSLVDTNVLSIGEKVTVSFLENVGYEVQEGDYVTFYCQAPTEKEYPVGSEMYVQFSSMSDDAQDENPVLYVDVVGKVVTIE